MRFSAVAATAILFGVALAAPHDHVVTEIEVVTITSCAPEVTDCPYASHTEAPIYTPPPVVEETPTYTTSEAPVATYPPPTYPNGTQPAYSAPPSVHPEPQYPEPSVHPEPQYPSDSPIPTYVPTGTGAPVPPANTSIPVVPVAPPQFEGAATHMGASLVAVFGAAAAALLL